jgi:hypothetical protein
MEPPSISRLGRGESTTLGGVSGRGTRKGLTCGARDSVASRGRPRKKKPQRTRAWGKGWGRGRDSDVMPQSRMVRAWGGRGMAGEGMAWNRITRGLYKETRLRKIQRRIQSQPWEHGSPVPSSTHAQRSALIVHAPRHSYSTSQGTGEPQVPLHPNSLHPPQLSSRPPARVSPPSIASHPPARVPHPPACVSPPGSRPAPRLTSHPQARVPPPGSRPAPRLTSRPQARVPPPGSRPAPADGAVSLKAIGLHESDGP